MCYKRRKNNYKYLNKYGTPGQIKAFNKLLDNLDQENICGGAMRLGSMVDEDKPDIIKEKDSTTGFSQIKLDI